MQPTRSILIIDYETTLANLLVEILIDEGYSAYAVPDGVDALVAIADELPALILLDLGKPTMHGVELVERVRETILATTPMVLMTTAPREAAPLSGPGLAECLHKPFGLDELLACVARYL